MDLGIYLGAVDFQIVHLFSVAAEICLKLLLRAFDPEAVVGTSLLRQGSRCELTPFGPPGLERTKARLLREQWRVSTITVLVGALVESRLCSSSGRTI